MVYEYSGEVIFDTTGNCYITGASSSMQVTFGEHTVYGLSGDGIFDLFGLKLDKNMLSQPSGSVVVKTMLNYYTPGYTHNKIKYINDIDKIIWLTTFKSGTLVAGQLNLPKVTPVGAFSSPEYAALCLDPASGLFLWGQNFGYNIDYETTFASIVNSSGVYFAVPLSNYYDLYLTGNIILSNNLEGSQGFAILHVTMDGRLAYVKSVLPEMPYDNFNLYGISLLRSGRVFVTGSYYSQSFFFLTETYCLLPLEVISLQPLLDTAFRELFIPQIISRSPRVSLNCLVSIQILVASNWKNPIFLVQVNMNSIRLLRPDLPFSQNRILQPTRIFWERILEM
jgi:hypothetical protein